MKKHLLAFGIIFLFLSSVVAPMTTGIKSEPSEVDDDPLRDYYGCYSLEEIPENIRPKISESEENQDNTNTDNTINSQDSYEPLTSPPMDSPWPMYCHDVRHTGRSSYSTAQTLGIEKWRFETNSGIGGGSVIDEDGIIYVGFDGLYAIYPNGTLKWKYEDQFQVMSTPAIDENDVIYIGAYWGTPYMYAINKEDGVNKWKFPVGDSIASSPAIGNNGLIFFGCEDGYIYALKPDGSLKWKYKTDDVVYSSPAISNDETVYCGSHDNNLYAFYSENGTLKWKYKTGHWIRTSPCIGDDGTVYCVSLDNYIYAISQNSSLKWRTNMGNGGTSPTIGHDGTIYAGYTKLFSINPSNGSVKWTFDVYGKIRGATPCHSIDGTIFLGNWDGSDIVAVNPDGTEKWRKSIGGDVDSPPSIDENGIVYIGSPKLNGGYLHAFGELDPNAPTFPIIDGPSTAKEEITKTFYFTSTSPFDRDVFYYVEWGDGKTTDWNGPHKSGEEITLGHAWGSPGSYTIKARAKDTDNLWGPWGEFEIVITRPRTRTSNWMQLLDMFSILKEVILRLAK